MAQRMRVEYPDLRSGEEYIAVILDNVCEDENVLVVKVKTNASGAWPSIEVREAPAPGYREDSGERSSEGWAWWTESADLITSLVSEANDVAQRINRERKADGLRVEAA